MKYKIYLKIKHLFFVIKKRYFISYLTNNLSSLGYGFKMYGKDLPIIKGVSNIKIGNDFRINEFAYLNARDKSQILIGDSVTISSYAKIITASYDVKLLIDGKKNLLTDIHSDKSIYIGNNCWIGMSSIILPGVRINGDNVIIAAGSVVTKTFEQSNILIAGNPAKIVKKYA
jgi:acetyltransferase-like isoleucine patch superfamily enzyme